MRLSIALPLNGGKSGSGQLAVSMSVLQGGSSLTILYVSDWTRDRRRESRLPEPDFIPVSRDSIET